MLASIASSCLFVCRTDLKSLARVFEEEGTSNTSPQFASFAMVGFESMEDVVGSDGDFLSKHSALDGRLKAIGLQIVQKAHKAWPKSSPPSNR